jgi:hypothetical protein
MKLCLTRKVRCHSITTLLLIMLSAYPGAGQEPCQCDEPCPTEYSYTNSTSNFQNTYYISGQSVYIPLLSKNVNVEIEICCRIRGANASTPFVTTPISASCETAIRCIRIAKDELVNYAQPGNPPSSADLRRELIQAVLALVMCENRCGHGLPAPGQAPIEWVFSIPKCLDWTKTSTSSNYWCLKNCTDRHTYCVYAYKMTTGTGGLPKPVERVVSNWTEPNESAQCGLGGATCMTEPCYTSFPDCASWDLSGKTW